MGPAIFIVGIVAAGVYHAIKGIGDTREARHRREAKEQEESESTDVQVLGQVLPQEHNPYSYQKLPYLRQPGAPLWDNHRLFEDLLNRPSRHLPPDYFRNLHPPSPGLNTPPVQPFIWQNDRSLEEIMASIRNRNIPSAPSNTGTQRNHETDGLEDPFADGDVEGWTYENGQRRRI